MSHQHHDENDSSYNDSVPTECLESVFLHVSDEELDGKHGHDESNYVADYQGCHVVHNQVCSSFFQ